MKANESEMAKYMHNVFLATKVVIFNEFFDVCINNKINYDAALNAALSQEKIGSSHTQVAPDGKAGYSGACFPKDVVAFNARFADCKIEVIRKQWSINKKLRGEDQYISMYW
jgi:UDP-glucose 6-dehydrogenase